jgi:anti-sigma factor ChrR (cupin superfamily)
VKHAALTDKIVERAALYALGALTQIEAQAFEDHLAEGCEVCRRELDEYQLAVEGLALTTSDAEPSPAVRSRLLASLEGEASDGGTEEESATVSVAADLQPFVSLHAGEDGWQKWGEGILYKPLYVDEASGLMTSIVRMSPGTGLPRHQHLGVEQFLILEGDCTVHGEQLGPGDYHRALGGTIHDTTYTEHGTTFLLVAPKEYRLLGSR